MATKLYCGLDFHKISAEICVLDQLGGVVEQARVKSEKLVEYLSNRTEYHIGVEASGGVFDITARLEAAGHRVTIINPSQFRAIGITGKKNDKNDAKALATALRLGFVPEVHKKTLYSRRIKSLLASRDLVVRTRTQFVNHVRGILREYGLPMPSGITSFWTQVNSRIESLECEVMQRVLKALVDQAAALKDQQVAIEEALQMLTKEDERIARLESVPGVGRLTATAFVATFEEVARFANAKRAGAFLGLTPRENSSGNKIRFGSITKCGPELLRRYLIHGARASMRYAPTPDNKIRSWADRIDKRAGMNKAVVALAHKNARICFALLRDGSRFGERKKAQARAA